ncbi:MAG: family 10 glycosylhydrolase [Verrucomicrobia subdivision 3 bacterium]|nr:family 10 glycosylhydrolase [Limisphaerales bacterium]
MTGCIGVGRFVLGWMLASCGLAVHAQSPEFRALWVDTFHAGIKSGSQITTLVNDLRAGNFNAVIPEVRKRGDAYYNSAYEPKAADMTITDALADLIAKAHNTNNGPRIEVHPWIVTYNIWNSQTTPPSEPNHPYNLHREWLTQNEAGAQWDGGNYAFDPGHPEVQRHTFDVAMDIISNYDVDGFNFDYIRYAGNTWGYNPVSVARFNRRFGRTGQPAATDPEWLQFRRDQVTALVRKVYLSAIALKPHIKISADTITWAPGPTSDLAWTNSSAAYRNVLQDWRSWMQEGILDINIPMTYFRQNTHPTDYINWCNFARDRAFNRHCVIGPGIYLNSLSNSLVQMRLTRMPSPGGNVADGICGYSYAVPTSNNLPRSTFLTALTQASTSRLYETNATPIFATAVPTPAMPWKAAPAGGHLKGFVYGGSVTNPLDGATVTLTGVVQRTAIADATGFYGFVDLPPGNYGVRSSLAGFAPAASSVVITAGVVSTADLLLTTNETVPPIISGVNAIDITDSGARIIWNTDEPTSSIVDYGASAGYGSSRTNTALVYAHSMQLSNLTANATYHYRVRSRDAAGNLATSGDFVFVTNPLGVVSDIIVDNPEASVAGTWSTGTSATDKYGVNYRFKGQGSGSGYLRFTPNILRTGQYAIFEWHSEGSNRTTNAQYVVTCTGGAATRYVNQQINGGQWNLLGSFPFGGWGDCVDITDRFSESGSTVVIADALKFVYVPTPPTITMHPQSRTVRVGSNVTFTASATGTPPLTYQWQFNGSELAGATGPSFARVNVNTNHAGEYSLVVSNMAGTAQSSNALLTVTLPAAPSIQQVVILETGVRLWIASESGFPVQIEASQTLTNWAVLGTVTNTTGTATFLDGRATNRPGRFYRLQAR